MATDFAPQLIDLERIFTLTAIGQSSGFTAQTAFKDGSVNVKTVGTTGTAANVDWARYDTTSCTGAVSASGTISASTSGNGTGIPGGTTSGQSLLLTAQTLTGFSFTNWTGSVPGAPNTSNPICVPHQNATRQIDLNYSVSANTTTTVTSSQNSSTFGQSVTFTATVTRTSGSGTPVGTVQFKVNGMNLGSSVALSVVNATNASATSIAIATLAAGTHVITAEYAPGAGFNSSTGTLAGGQVVNRLTIVVTPTAGQFKTYGSADPTLTYGSAPALISGDSFTGELARDPGTNVGFYNITQGTLALSSNYTLNFTSGVQFEIKKRSISLAAEPKSKFYGDADPTLTYQITSGSLKSGDTLTGALIRAAGENVGAYAISQGTLAISDGNSDPDGTYTFAGALLTINKRPITITADAKSKIYSESDPALTYQVTSGSLVFGDIFTGALSRVTGELVGTYAIQQGTLGLNNNYILTYIGANLTITTGFAFNGFHSPVGGSVENGDGGTYANPVKSFKLGSTIPVKFGASWLNGGGALITGIHTLHAIKYSNSTVSEPAIDATPMDAATTGNQFRLTSTDWHFNLSTKGNGFTAGTWLLSATLVDGSQHTVWISIKK